MRICLLLVLCIALGVGPAAAQQAQTQADEDLPAAASAFQLDAIRKALATDQTLVVGGRVPTFYATTEQHLPTFSKDEIPWDGHSRLDRIANGALVTFDVMPLIYAAVHDIKRAYRNHETRVAHELVERNFQAFLAAKSATGADPH